jgi:hypothetical protein
MISKSRRTARNTTAEDAQGTVTTSNTTKNGHSSRSVNGPLIVSQQFYEERSLDGLAIRAAGQRAQQAQDLRRGLVPRL